MGQGLVLGFSTNYLLLVFMQALLGLTFIRHTPLGGYGFMIPGFGATRSLITDTLLPAAKNASGWVADHGGTQASNYVMSHGGNAVKQQAQHMLSQAKTYSVTGAVLLNPRISASVLAGGAGHHLAHTPQAISRMAHVASGAIDTVGHVSNGALGIVGGHIPDLALPVKAVLNAVDPSILLHNPVYGTASALTILGAGAAGYVLTGPTTQIARENLAKHLPQGVGNTFRFIADDLPVGNIPLLSKWHRQANHWLANTAELGLSKKFQQSFATAAADVASNGHLPLMAQLKRQAFETATNLAPLPSVDKGIREAVAALPEALQKQILPNATDPLDANALARWFELAPDNAVATLKKLKPDTPEDIAFVKNELKTQASVLNQSIRDRQASLLTTGTPENKQAGLEQLVRDVEYTLKTQYPELAELHQLKLQAPPYNATGKPTSQQKLDSLLETLGQTDNLITDDFALNRLKPLTEPFAQLVETLPDDLVTYEAVAQASAKAFKEANARQLVIDKEAKLFTQRLQEGAEDFLAESAIGKNFIDGSSFAKRVARRKAAREEALKAAMQLPLPENYFGGLSSKKVANAGYLRNQLTDVALSGDTSKQQALRTLIKEYADKPGFEYLTSQQIDDMVAKLAADPTLRPELGDGTVRWVKDTTGIKQPELKANNNDSPAEALIKRLRNKRIKAQNEALGDAPKPVELPNAKALEGVEAGVQKVKLGETALSNLKDEITAATDPSTPLGQLTASILKTDADNPFKKPPLSWDKQSLQALRHHVSKGIGGIGGVDIAFFDTAPVSGIKQAVQNLPLEKQAKLTNLALGYFKDKGYSFPALIGMAEQGTSVTQLNRDAKSILAALEGLGLDTAKLARYYGLEISVPKATVPVPATTSQDIIQAHTSVDLNTIPSPTPASKPQRNNWLMRAIEQMGQQPEKPLIERLRQPKD
jgi:hypothetical protein